MKRDKPMTDAEMAEFISQYMRQADRWQTGRLSKFTEIKTVGKLSFFDMQVTKKQGYRIIVERL